MPYSTEQIRNIALTGHAGAGKTLLFEALMQAGGAIRNAGSIERGTTFSDSDPMEKERGHSINTTIAAIDHGDVHINLIDTPGYADFRGPTLSALAAVETCAVVIDAERGIEHGSQRLMHYARARRLCRLLVVNKIDLAEPDLAALVDDLRQTFGNECLPINLPAEQGTAVVDCFFQSGGDSDFASVAQAHQTILDQVVEVNEEIMGRYLEDGEAAVSGKQLADAFVQCLREGHLVPICFVSARTGAGVPELLRLIEELMPHPGEANPPLFTRGQGAEAEPFRTVPDPQRDVIADVFKIVNDPFAGKLSIFRVYQGTVRKDSQLYIDDGRKPFKVGHLYRLMGREHGEIDCAIPGDIAAVAKVEDIHFDAVLHDSRDADHIHLQPIDFPQPMFGLAVEPASKGQEQKLATALHRLAEEDPCFHVEHSKELNETVIRGLGELHSRVMLERMKTRYGVEVNTRPPRIAYRETISARADGHHRHKKQTGGAGQFGEVFLRIEPLARGEGFQFASEVVGGAIPGQFIPAVEKGVRQAMATGAVAGQPLQDVRVIVYDGKYHGVDSKEVAFITAGRKAFLDAVSKARPIVLEPLVNIDVKVPEQFMGDVSSDLAGKRARINGTDSLRGGQLLIRAQVPVSELGDYVNQLKAMTGGQGRYTLEMSHYEPVPPQVQKQLSEAYRPRPDDD
ncbi:MAG: elongation factor G [Xanthomonadales bacterium]|nr:elongation factor G [Xanthomonadales bacterium]